MARPGRRAVRWNFRAGVLASDADIGVAIMAQEPADLRIEFRRIIHELCACYDAPDILEIGGGARPMFQPGEWPENLGSYTINDISQDELDEAPSDYRTACFDICDPVESLDGSFDVIFSQFVAEHVRNGEEMHRNVRRLLKPGGVAFHLFPTLYSLPFVINRWIPEGVSKAMLSTLEPLRVTRNRKFPAYYSWCAGTTDRIRSQIESVGYSDVRVDRFYAHNYLRKFPVLGSVEAAWVRTIQASGMSSLGAYALVYAYR